MALADTASPHTRHPKSGGVPRRDTRKPIISKRLATRVALGAFLGPEAFDFPTFSAYSAGVGVSYDLDVFGGNHRRIELAAADAEVQSDDLAAARLSIAGDTVIETLQIASMRPGGGGGGGGRLRPADLDACPDG